MEDQYNFPQPDPVPGFESTYGGQPQMAPMPSFSQQSFQPQPMPSFSPTYLSQGTMPMAANFAMQDAQRTLQATLQGSIMAAQSFSQRVGSIMSAGNHAIFGRPQEIQYAGPGQYAFNSTMRAELFYSQGASGMGLAIAGGPKPQFMSEGMYQRALSESFAQRFSAHNMIDYAGSMAGLALPMMGMGLIPGLAVGLGAPLAGKVARGLDMHLYEQKEREEGWRRDMFTRYQRGTSSFLSRGDSYDLTNSLSEHDSHSMGARMLSEFGFEGTATKYFRKDQIHMEGIREKMQSLDMFRGSSLRGKDMGDLVKKVATEMKEFAEIAGMVREESLQVMAALQKGSGLAAGSQKLNKLWGSAAWTAAATGANPNEIVNLGNQAMMVARMNGGDASSYAQSAFRQFRNVSALQQNGVIDPAMDASGYAVYSHQVAANGLRSNPFYWAAASPTQSGSLATRAMDFFRSRGGGDMASGVVLAMNGGADVNDDPSQINSTALRMLSNAYQKDGKLNYAAARRLAAMQLMNGDVEKARALEAETLLNTDGNSNIGRINEMSALVRDKDRLRKHLMGRGMSAQGADSVIAGMEDQLSTKGPVDSSTLGLVSERYRNLMAGSQARDFVDSKLGRIDGWGNSVIGQAMINGNIKVAYGSNQLASMKKDHDKALDQHELRETSGSKFFSRNNKDSEYEKFRSDFIGQATKAGWSHSDALKMLKDAEANGFRDFDTAFTKGKAIDQKKLGELSQFVNSEFGDGSNMTNFATRVRDKANALFGGEGSETAEAALNAAILRSGKSKQIQVARDSMGLTTATDRAANTYFLLKGAATDLGGYRSALQKHFGKSVDQLYNEAGLAGKSYSEQAIAAEEFLRKNGLASFGNFGSYVAAMLNNDGAVGAARGELSRRSDLEGVEELSEQKIKAAGRALKNRSDALGRFRQQHSKEYASYQEKYGVDFSQGYDREAATLIENLRTASSPSERAAALEAVKKNGKAKSFLYGSVLSEVNEKERDNILQAMEKGQLTGDMVKSLDPAFRPQGVAIEGLSAAYDLKTAQEEAMKKQDELKEKSAQAISKFADIISLVYTKVVGK